MTLRLKLILIALVALLLPWAGFQFIKQMELLLREGQERAQLSSARALAQAFVATAPELPAAGRVAVLPEAPPVLLLDGSADDWQSAALQPWPSVGPVSRVHLAARASVLYGLIEVQDRSRMRADPDALVAGAYDHIELHLGGGERRFRYQLGNAAPGPLQVQADAADAPALQGEWAETTDGYRIEFSLFLPRDGMTLAADVVDTDQSHTTRTLPVLGDPGRGEASLVLWLSDSGFTRALQPLVPPGARLRVLAADAHVLGKAGKLEVGDIQARTPWPNSWIYRALLAPPLVDASDYAWDLEELNVDEVWQALSGIEASVWRPSNNERTVIVAAVVPLRWGGATRGALVLEQSSDALLVIANDAVAKLMAASLIAVLVASFVLFGFAGVLSFRIRRLRNATERALRPDGRLDPKLPHLKAVDEVGDLSRSFARLLDEIGGYNEYLRTLASKLSHELNTPLAIVRSSLDNLDHEPLPPEARVYADRARAGADRLWGILRTMAEASRMEKAIQAAEAEDFDLTGVVRGCAESYRGIAGNRQLHVMLPESPIRLHGAPDLIAQALDKLFDNAKGFTPEGGWIRIKLVLDAEGAEIGVANSGPPLPAKMQERLFDSLVSMRDAGSLRAAGEVPHLGLGLYIVRLIAEAHDGSALAYNLPAEAGVEFRLRLKGMPR
ncbi:MAG: histidine kinase [Xanthomonadales bacterium]|nr:histidine kinase [Xanthomonadales bacterium]